MSGRVLNNSAVMPNATLGYPCSAVYVIDTVLLPAATLSEIPPFSAIGALQRFAAEFLLQNSGERTT